MSSRAALIGSIGLAFAIVLASFAAMPAAAANVNITLFGHRTGGWGLTNTSVRSPGPDLLVAVGDNVTLTLNATDTNTHDWYIDYDDNSNRGPNEPQSPTFPAQGRAVVWNFTADRNGTFHYRSSRAQDEAAMWGNITIAPAAVPPGFDVTILGIIALGVGFIALIAVVTWYGRRKKGQVPPPPET